MKPGFVFWITLFGLCSCNHRLYEGPTAKDFRSLEQHHSLSVIGKFDVRIQPDLSSDILFIAPEDALKNLIAEIENGKLVVYHNDSSGYLSQDIELHIRNDSLRELELYGHVNFSGSFKNEDSLSVKYSGYGSVRCETYSEFLETAISGSADVLFRGECSEHYLDVRFDEIREMNFSKLKTNHSEVKVKGKGGVVVFVTDFLDATVRGSGYIHYLGNPEKVSTSLFGLGEIKPL